jgi:hypothetical protein
VAAAAAVAVVAAAGAAGAAVWYVATSPADVSRIICVLRSLLHCVLFSLPPPIIY